MLFRSKMHAAKRRKDGGPLDGPFDEAVEAQAAREAAATRLAGDIRPKTEISNQPEIGWSDVFSKIGEFIGPSSAQAMPLPRVPRLPSGVISKAGEIAAESVKPTVPVAPEGGVLGIMKAAKEAEPVIPAPAPEGGVLGAMKEAKEIKEKPLDVSSEQKIDQPVTGGTEDYQFTSLEKTAREQGVARITAKERDSLTELAKKSGVDPNKTIEALREKRKRYPTSQGWEPFEVVGFERDSSKKIKFDESGLPELKIKEQPYQFHQKLDRKSTRLNSSHITI